MGLLLELFDGTFVDTTTFVDQVTGGGRLARVYVTDDDDVDVSLFLAHCDWSLGSVEQTETAATKKEL